MYGLLRRCHDRDDGNWSEDQSDEMFCARHVKLPVDLRDLFSLGRPGAEERDRNAPRHSVASGAGTFACLADPSEIQDRCSKRCGYEHGVYLRER